MKKLSFLFSLAVLFVTLSVQAQNHPTNYGPEGDSGKCYAQCLIPGDTVKVTEQVKIKPGYKEPYVVEGYPSTTPVTYTVKEECTTCEFSEEKSTKTETRDVVVRPGYWEYFTTPCEYMTVIDTVLVKEGSVKYKIYDPKFEKGEQGVAISGRIEEGICTPAVTSTEKRTVEIEEACVDIEVADYLWEDEIFEIEVQAATKKWVKQKADKNCLSADPEDCLVWCLVDVPAVNEKCTRKVKKGCPYGYEDNGAFCIKRTPTPPKTKTIEVVTCEEAATFEKAVAIVDKFERVPVELLEEAARYEKIVEEPVYETIKRKVLVTPAKLDSTYHDPIIKTITLQVEEKTVTGIITRTPAVEESCEKTLCVEPEVKTRDHGPEYKEVTKIEIKKGEFTSWEEVLCPVDVNNYTIMQLQHALRERGYDPGPADNLLGDKTKAALTRYQKENDLPVGQLDMKTLTTLGIIK